MPDIDTLLAIMATLRTPGSGCAWDIAQTHESLVPFVLEEAYEVADAVEHGRADQLCDELGDLLLQIVFHAQVASEAGDFAFPDVVRAISNKMVRRHPHVFARAEDAQPLSSEAIVANWESIKADERREAGPRGALADVPLALPGLTRAVKLQKKASRVGFDWGDVRLVLDKVREEVEEIAQAVDEAATTRDEAVASEIGDLLFAIANLARHAGIDPEAAVRGTNAKFERRFAFIEERLAQQGSSPMQSSLQDMDALWDEAKAAGM